jgi:hypothetical protein
VPPRHVEHVLVVGEGRLVEDPRRSKTTAEAARTDRAEPGMK